MLNELLTDLITSKKSHKEFDYVFIAVTINIYINRTLRGRRDSTEVELLPCM